MTLETWVQIPLFASNVEREQRTKQKNSKAAPLKKWSEAKKLCFLRRSGSYPLSSPYCAEKNFVFLLRSTRGCLYWIEQENQLFSSEFLGEAPKGTE